MERKKGGPGRKGILTGEIFGSRIVLGLTWILKE